MSNSSLVNVTVKAHSSNYDKGRTKKISKITIHHMAGKLTAKECGNVFKRANRGASAHYGVGTDGKVGLYVNECDTAWADGNWNSNCKSVSIETANSQIGGNWKVSDKTLKKLIELVADIAKRNKLGDLVVGKNLTYHSMYAATTCPGNYLRSKMEYIAKEANKINNKKTTTTKTTSTFKSYKVVVTCDVLNVRRGAGTNYKVVQTVKENEVYTIVAEKTVSGTKWGKLKSGAGWISLKYTSKLK